LRQKKKQTPMIKCLILPTIDKMLDIADNLFEFLESSKIKLNENQLEDLSLLLAENKDKLMPILRGIKPKKKPAKKPEQKKPAQKESTPPKKVKTKK